MDLKGSGRAPGPFFLSAAARKAAAGLAVCLALAAWSCTEEVAPTQARSPKPRRDSGPATRSPQPSPTPLAQEPGVEELIYVDRTTLYSYDLGTEERTKLVELPSADVAVSGDGSQFVVVVETDPSADDDAFVAPVLQLGDRDGDLVELGPGRSPIWSPLGDAVAALGTDGSVSVYFAARGKDQGGGPLEAAGTVENILGWTLGNVGLLVSQEGQSRVVEFAGDAAGSQSLKVPTSEIWGVSPSKLQLLVIEDSNRVALAEGKDRVPVDLGGGLPADGAWSPNGARIAVVTVKGMDTELVVIDTSTGSVEAVADSKDAQGNVIWSSDSKSFSYVRVDPDSRQRLQAVVCTNTSECARTFSWGQGITLLSLR